MKEAKSHPTLCCFNAWITDFLNRVQCVADKNPVAPQERKPRGLNEGEAGDEAEQEQQQAQITARLCFSDEDFMYFFKKSTKTFPINEENSTNECISLRDGEEKEQLGACQDNWLSTKKLIKVVQVILGLIAETMAKKAKRCVEGAVDHLEEEQEMERVVMSACQQGLKCVILCAMLKEEGEEDLGPLRRGPLGRDLVFAGLVFTDWNVLKTVVDDEEDQGALPPCLLEKFVKSDVGDGGVIDLPFVEFLKVFLGEEMGIGLYCVRNWAKMLRKLCYADGEIVGETVEADGLQFDRIHNGALLNLFRVCSVKSDGNKTTSEWLLGNRSGVTETWSLLLQMLSHFESETKYVALCCLELMLLRMNMEDGHLLIEIMFESGDIFFEMYKLLKVHISWRDEARIVEQNLTCLLAVLNCCENNMSLFSAHASRPSRSAKKPAYGKALPYLSARSSEPNENSGRLLIQALPAGGTKAVGWGNDLQFVDECLSLILKAMKYEDKLVLRRVYITKLCELVDVLGPRSQYWLKYVLPVVSHYVKTGTFEPFEEGVCVGSSLRNSHRTQNMALVCLVKILRACSDLESEWIGNCIEAIVLYCIQLRQSVISCKVSCLKKYIQSQNSVQTFVISVGNYERDWDLEIEQLHSSVISKEARGAESSFNESLNAVEVCLSFMSSKVKHGEQFISGWKEEHTGIRFISQSTRAG
eukprot:Nk52_evm22s292 gene=Nk52_evmTU22s292